MEQIRNYLIKEKNMPDVVAERTIAKLARHPDIAQELRAWIENRTYETGAPVRAEGYTAADIAKLAPFLDGVGAFTFLISLREEPAKAKQQLTAGFPRK